jgi:hypothetical protein
MVIVLKERFQLVPLAPSRIPHARSVVEVPHAEGGTTEMRRVVKVPNRRLLSATTISRDRFKNIPPPSPQPYHISQKHPAKADGYRNRDHW